MARRGTVSSRVHIPREAGRAGQASPALIWLALGAVYVIWGSTYLAIREAVLTLPPLLMASVRFLVAGALLYVWAIRRGHREGDRPGWPEWRSAFVVGSLLLLVGNGGVVLAERSVPSGVAALVIATIPVWMAMIDRVFSGQRLVPQAIVGLALGFGGLAILVGGTGSGKLDLVGMVILLTAEAERQADDRLRHGDAGRRDRAGVRRRRAWGVRPDPPGTVQHRVSSRPRVPDRIWVVGGVLGVHLALADRAHLARLDLRVRQPCGGGVPRVGLPVGTDHSPNHGGRSGHRCGRGADPFRQEDSSGRPGRRRPRRCAPRRTQARLTRERLHQRGVGGERQVLLQCVGCPEDRGLVQELAHDLETHRKPVGGQPARDADGRHPGEVRRDGEDVREVHGKRILGLLPQPERGRR